jgi:tRNA threonylcarbamoyl adenosine modification protein YeaZ
VDSSSEWLNLVLMKGDQLVYTSRSFLRHGHARALLPQLYFMLSTHDLVPADMDVFGVCTGPGSFTGLRVGVTTVKAWAGVFGKPVAAVPSTDVLVAGTQEYDTVACAIDARRGEVFFSLHQKAGEAWTLLVPPFADTPEQGLGKLTAQCPPHHKNLPSGTCLMVGSAVSTYQDRFASSFPTMRLSPDPRWNDLQPDILGRTCLDLFLKTGGADHRTVEPCYARGPVIG